MRDFEIDHTDPSWSEGRDYQIVCGLNVVYNMAERCARLNSQKANRFLPWRNSFDELGSDPVEQGDLCLFLDPDTNEWVLEEFLGEWWFEKSTHTDARRHQTHERDEAMRRNYSKAQKGVKKKPFTEEHKRNIAIAARNRPPRTKEHNQRIAEAARRRYAK